MAFNHLTFSPVGGQSTRGSAPQVFSYVTTESRATIETANYFDGASSYIEANDILKVVYDGGYGEYKVTQVTINGAVSIQSTETLAGLNVVTKTADYTATNNDDVILCNATSAAITITLYTAVGNEGQQLVIKKTDSSVNEVTIDADGTETIDGELTVCIDIQYDSLTLISDNTNWSII
jgi:hypothetical protein